jgi:type I restriction enzyme S subunit
LLDHRGRTPKKLGGDFTSEGIPVVSAKNVHDGELFLDGETRFISPRMYDEWMPVRLRAGDVLLTSEAPLGEAAYLRGTRPLCLGQRLFGLRADPLKLDGRFLYYSLRSPNVQQRLRARQTGTTAEGIRQSELVKVEIDVPSIQTQRAISSVLGSLDDKIELNRRMNQTLERIGQALFESWFVDFDPARAKADGRWKNGGSLPGMPAEMWGLWPSEFEDAEIGEIPKGWEVKPLSEVASVARGVSYRSEDLAESDTALVSLKCAGRDGTYHEDGLKAYRGDFKPEQIVKPGEVVVSHTDVTQRAEVIGRAYRVRPSSKFARLVASLDMAVVRPTSRGQTREYLTHALAAERFRDHCYGYTNGTTVLHLSPLALPDYPHLVPSPKVVGEFSEIVSHLNGLLDEHGFESALLSETRDALLPKLLSGEIRLPVNGGE